MKVLLTGGAGYIGLHTAVVLTEAGHDVVIADDHSNCPADAVRNAERITGKSIREYVCDVCDADALRRVFSENGIDAVIHFAGFKAVGESVEKPLVYYRNNLCSTMTLMETMTEFGVKRVVFSSSATVYGEAEKMPVTEDMPVGGCSNPYGWTKYMTEQIMTDAANADSGLSVVLLRYFNPVGAHPSGLIGESPNGVPNNLMPYICQVAAGRLERLGIFGDDYPTPDGTGVRDYIHVMDLAEGHLAALEYAAGHTGVQAVNLGTGRGTSVLELVRAFERANGVSVPYAVTDRRAGDLAECWADTSKAERVFGWKASRGIEEMCRDAWNWEKNRKG